MAQEDKNKRLSPLVGEFSIPLDHLSKIYKQIHQDPELGEHEKETSSTASEFLKHLGFDIHPNIGGHGAVGLLRNGDGPTILLRADMVRESWNVSPCVFAFDA